jgi:putative transposase
MDVSMMARMKGLEKENRRLRKMIFDERLKAEIVQEALAKSGEAISTLRDGQTSGSRGKCFHQGGTSGLPGQRDLLSVPAQA